MTETDEQIRERSLKHIERISKNLRKPKGSKLTEDQQKALQKLEKKYGKVAGAHKSKQDANKDDNNGKDENGAGAGAGIRANAELVLDSIKTNYDKLFVDEYQNPHIAISVSGHIETLPIKSKRFRNWLANIFYKTTGLVVKSQDLKDVINILSAEAEFDSGEPIKLNLRVAKLNGKWYYDLTNKNWEFIEIASEGWRTVKNLILFPSLERSFAISKHRWQYCNLFLTPFRIYDSNPTTLVCQSSNARHYYY